MIEEDIALAYTQGYDEGYAKAKQDMMHETFKDRYESLVEEIKADYRTKILEILKNG